jgi:hypothetical protein
VSVYVSVAQSLEVETAMVVVAIIVIALTGARSVRLTHCGERSRG